MIHQRKIPKFAYAFLGLMSFLLFLFAVSRLDSNPKTFELENGTKLSWVNCWFGQSLARQTYCGELLIPGEKGTHKETVLSVVVFQKNFWKPSQHPLLYLTGGPGGSARLQHLQAWSYWFDRAQLNQDLVLVDQRGVGLSQPSLTCPGIQNAHQEYFKTRIVNPIKTEQKIFNELQNCRQTLLDAGHDLSLYNTTRFAQDSNALMTVLEEALEYQEWNIYGVSYGTKWAQEILRSYPDKIRTVILDSVLPITSDKLQTLDNYPWLVHHALERFFKGCKVDSSCKKSNPNLRRDFYELLRSLNASPRSFSIPKGLKKSDANIEVFIDGHKLQRLIFDLLYRHQSIDLPQAISKAADGDFQPLQSLLKPSLNSVLFDQSFQEPIYYSVICTEEYLMSQSEYNQQIKGFPAIAPYLYPHTGQHACDFWTQNRAPETFQEPVKSNIPTLLFSGENDPVTPPIFARGVQQHLSNSHHIVIPNQGHGAIPENACAVKIMTQFLRSPDEDIDQECLGIDP